MLVIDIGDNDAIVFKLRVIIILLYVEPYQGAATGVGGISLRDVFTMGARPIVTKFNTFWITQSF